MIEWTVTPTEAGPALPFLQGRIPAAPRSYLRQLFRTGKVHGHQAPLSETSPLQPGDLVRITESGRLMQLLQEPAAPTLDILHESREMIIVDKPAGLAIHRGKGHENDNLLARVQALMKSRQAHFSVAPVHRLDLETSGPVLFGKGRQATSRLGQLFMDNLVHKHYLALVAGTMASSGLLATPVSAKGKLKEASTSFRVIASANDLTLVELELHTGRTHQIRQQLSTEGHPLVGDRRYKGPQMPELDRMFLHCHRLSLPAPFGGTAITVTSPLPSELLSWLQRWHPDIAREFIAKNAYENAD